MLLHLYTDFASRVGLVDVAPFVGHNALLRWSAVQDVSFMEEGIRKFWAEDTVSEDFELSLR